MELVLRYMVRDGRPTDIAWHNPDLLDAVGTVYARRVDGDIVYVGKAERALRRRLAEHVSLTTRGKNPDFASFAEGKRVEIVAMKAGTIEAMGMTVDITSSVEKALIEKLNPRFNKRRG